MEGKAWEIEQLAAPGTLLQLSGWSAPFGRERQETLVEDAIEARKATYYYSGNSEPTVHSFGSKLAPIELHGRWRDKRSGKGFAVATVATVKKMVADAVRVRVSWGDVLAVEGFLANFVPSREAEGEVAWRLTIDVHKDLYAKDKPKKVKEPVSTAYIEKVVAADLATMFASTPSLPSTDIFTSLDNLLSLPTNIAGAFIEKLDSLVSLVTGTIGQFQKAANAVQNLETATFATLSKLLNASVQMRGTIAGFRGAYTSVAVDAAILRERAADNAQWWKGQTSAEAAMRDLVATLGDTERKVHIRLRGAGAKSYVVRQGDTWESIAVAMYGSPDRAGDIQDANGAGPGSAPIPGTELVIPP